MIPIYFVHTHPDMPLDTCGIKAYPLSFHDGTHTFAIPKLGPPVKPAQAPASVVSVDEANRWLGKLDWLKDAKMAVCRWNYVNRDGMLRLTVWTLPEALPDNPDPDEPEWYKPSSVFDKLTEAALATVEHRNMADEAAAAWIDKHITYKGIDRDSLTKADWFLLSRSVPCEVRCWRVGTAVKVEPGEACPECGKVRPTPSVWERLMDE